MIEDLVCRGCRRPQARSSFSKNQRTKHVDAPMCLECVAEAKSEPSARQSIERAIGIFRAADERRRHVAANEKRVRDAEAARARRPWSADPCL